VTPPADEKPLSATLSAGLRGRCPRCGDGSLFSGFLDIASTCTACGLGLAGHDSGDGPAFVVSFIVGAVVVALAAVLEFTLHPPLWVHAAIWFPAVIGGSLAMLRPLKGLTVAIQFHTRATDEPEQLGGQ
jgi:uncharacterized protein (DUF983 family)